MGLLDGFINLTIIRISSFYKINQLNLELVVCKLTKITQWLVLNGTILKTVKNINTGV